MTNEVKFYPRSAAHPLEPLLIHDREILTQQTWIELFQKATSREDLLVPSCLVGVVQVQGKVHYYDGIQLRKNLRINRKDPHTNLPIEKLTYFVIKCFDLRNHERIKPQDPGLHEVVLENFNAAEAYLESHNFHAGGTAANIEILAKCQFAAAGEMKLRGDEDYLRFLYCSAKNGFELAQHHYDNS